MLYNGGTLYIDEGKPVPGAIETTVKNLREIPTNWYFTVPKGYEALLPYLRADAQLRQTFFSRLKVLWFAGAALSQSVFDEMQELAYATCGERSAGFDVRKDQRTDLVAIGSGDDDIARIRLERLQEATAQRTDVHPSAGRKLEILGDSAVEQQAGARIAGVFEFERVA